MYERCDSHRSVLRSFAIVFNYSISSYLRFFSHSRCFRSSIAIYTKRSYYISYINYVHTIEYLQFVNEAGGVQHLDCHYYFVLRSWRRLKTFVQEVFQRVIQVCARLNDAVVFIRISLQNNLLNIAFIRWISETVKQKIPKSHCFISIWSSAIYHINFEIKVPHLIFIWCYMRCNQW